MPKAIAEPPVVQVDGNHYLRIPIKTHLLTKDDSIPDVVNKYALPQMEERDLLFISEKAMAITQGRAILLEEIEPRFLARFLARFVKKVSYGIGLGMPETMEMAFREVGTWRILLAALISVLGKLIGRSGDFYRVAGRQVAMIDGPTPYTIPPYNKYVVLAPQEPERIAERIKEELNIHCAIVDINDIGQEVVALSSSSPITEGTITAVLRDNPLGQGNQQTPMGLIRPLLEEEARALNQVATALEN